MHAGVGQHALGPDVLHAGQRDREVAPGAQMRRRGHERHVVAAGDQSPLGGERVVHGIEKEEPERLIGARDGLPVLTGEQSH